MRACHVLFGLLIILSAWIFFSKINYVSVEQLDDTGAVRIKVKFLVPMKSQNLDEKIQLISERPGKNFVKSVQWIDDTTLEIFAVEEGLPRGFKTWLYIKPLKTKLPGLYKSVKVCYRANIPPFLSGLSPVVPSSGPLTLEFSTPVKKEELEKHLKTGFEFDLKPALIMREDGKFFKDCSIWHVLPEKRLQPGSRYTVEFEGLLENMAGSSAKAGFSKVFKVPAMPEVVSTVPVNGSNDVPVYTSVSVSFNQDMEHVSIRMGGMTGDTEIKGKTAVYKPHTVFMPGKEYKVSVCGRSIFGEEMEPYSFGFSVADMGDKLWVEVNLRRLQKVVVYRGSRMIRSMLASGGLPGPENETPLGFFTIKDRGESFWSDKYREGALYWVRIKDDYLFHSVPRDSQGNIIREEHEKLGMPASHGCIRLKDEDARWFYENILEGTLVVIHD